MHEDDWQTRASFEVSNGWLAKPQSSISCCLVNRHFNLRSRHERSVPDSDSCSAASDVDSLKAYTSASARLADRRQPNIATGVVDDLQHGLPKGSILESELGKQAAVIEKVGGVGWLGATFPLEMNPGIRKVRTDDVSDLP